MSSTAGRRVRVALDAMGGDHAPEEPVKGAIAAATTGEVDILLVGDPKALEEPLRRHSPRGLTLKVVPSEGIITETDSPVQGLRQKPRASVAVAAGLVKAGQADAFVTMGSTGAAMTVATLLLGLLEGIERPALGGPILGVAPKTVIVDLGSNVDCRPGVLVSFGALGAVFARTLLEVPQPRVALLSVGAEEGKGNRQVRETFELFRRSGLNFIGNVEGHDLPAGKAEVVVCDGFVGNVLMKFAEGLGASLAQHLRGRSSVPGAESFAQEIYDLTNVVEQAGGGPLLGINGVAVIGHGRARAPAIANAIGTARRAIAIGFVQGLRDELARLREKVQA
ncbi:MAG: phosphate acyltransferase PlsX [Chloroflexi bacterium]|nr:phosphate acyltransferase PlsX [Chloroflexota bacterium]